MKAKALLASVLHSKVEPYIRDYVSSLSSQEENSFDLLIINEHCKIDKNFFQEIKGKSVIHSPRKKLTPAELRHYAVLCALRKRYDYLIFADIDDYFSSNRTAHSIKMLEKSTFVFNEMDIVNKAGALEKKSVLRKARVSSVYKDYKDILSYNIFGLSNTAVDVKALRGVCIPKDILAVDWWIYSILLLKKGIGRFIADSTTYYRQGSNLVGWGKELDERSLLLGIKVKEIHYGNLAAFCAKSKLHEGAEIYKKLLVKIYQLAKITKDRSFRRNYIRVVNSNMGKIFKGWWSNILTLDEWEEYGH